MPSVRTLILQWLLRKPGLLRLLFAIGRRFKPILKLGNTVMIFRHEDVVEAFERDDDFTLAKIMAPRMAVGAFVLGMDRSPQYNAERRLLHDAFEPADLERVQDLASDFCSAQINAARPEKRLDLVTEIAEYVPRNIVAQYFGVPGPSQDKMAFWQRKLASLIVDASPDAGGLQAEAARCADELNRYLEELIGQRLSELQGAAKPPDNFLNRLLRAHLAQPDAVSLDMVQRNIAGLCVTGTAPVTKALTLLVHQLLKQTDARDGARAAAEADDLNAVGHFAFEALRFNPLFPMQPRFCPRDTVLRANKPGATEIAAGSAVLLATLSAMFDGDAFYTPDRFKPGRAIGSYLHFGHGMHECFGRQIAQAQIPTIVMQLMRLPNLRRAPGRQGRIRYDGPAVDRLILLFD